MEESSYFVSAGAFAIVMVCWILFAATFLLRETPPQTKDAVKAPKSWIGIVLQGAGYPVMWAFFRRPIFSPVFDGLFLMNIVVQLSAAVTAAGSVLLTRAALRELGKQWSLEARLVEGHDLVTTGPYDLVRHPIYPAMLGMLIATAVVISRWWITPFGIAIFLIGTFIRIRFEEQLLAHAFGEKFRDWKSRVPGLIPFIRL
jgi:protein-S-isoprenylcysteine O-methyltransferase Ste14